MSHFASPFIVVNLGCEMLFVVDQRLKAQNIEVDKSERVLTDITTVLLHPKLLDELFIPQPVATHGVIKQLLQDISNASIMKLDDYSMSKLWDLMTMVFKWQLSIITNQNIFDITRHHLKSVTNVLPQNYPKVILENTLRRFDYLGQKFTDDDYKGLHSTMILWFSEYHTKISVLLRLGLQRKDGTFNMPASINPKILKNLGENIYKHDTKKNVDEDYGCFYADSKEIGCLLAPIENVSSEGNILKLSLPLEFGLGEKPKTIEIKREFRFEHIDMNIKNHLSVSDLNFAPNIPKSATEDLLEMMDNTVLNE